MRTHMTTKIAPVVGKAKPQGWRNHHAALPG